VVAGLTNGAFVNGDGIRSNYSIDNNEDRLEKNRISNFVMVIGLPNIIAGRRIVPELIQDAANPEAIAAETLRILTDKQVYTQMKIDLAEVKVKLGQTGAVKRVAEVILEVAEKKR
jgi:lipid A disaccharide synthetase